ncbi:hypothetical protein WSM22_33520 [Cytophagales bacterium WSM2-2]|nr:hypothetical protein WSM22_33520 [Cytophagales bacterium WSM2-2]
MVTSFLDIQGTSTVNFSAANTTVTAGGLNMSGTSQILGAGTNRNLNVGSFSVPASQSPSIQNIALSVTGMTQIDGTLTFTNGNSASKTFGGGLTISSTGNFTNTAQNVPITIGGNMVNNGSFNQGTGLVTFTGSSSNTVTGTAATTAFGGGIDVNKGTSQSSVLDIQCVITMPGGGLILDNGTFKLSSASTIVPFTSDPNFSSTCGLWCNGGTMSTTASLTFDGLVRVSAGSLTVGSATDVNLMPNHNSAGTLDVSGGVVNVAGRIGGSILFNYTQSGGTVTVGTSGCTSFSPFNMNTTGCNFTMTGGTLVIERPNGNAGFVNYSATGSFTGGTLQLGDGSSPSSTISVDSGFPVYNLTVNSSNVTGRITNQELTISNDFNISAGSFSANSLGLTVKGNWTNNGTFTPTAAAVTLSGTGLQTISGSATTSFNDLVINNTRSSIPAISASASFTVTGIATMTAGTVNLNGNTFTLSSTAAGALVHGLASSNGWMYGGTISRAFAAAAITLGNVRGFIPIGTAANFRPFFFGKTNNGGSNGTIAMTHTDPGTKTGVTVADGTSTIFVRNDSKWASTFTGGTGATFGIRYGGTGLGAITTLSDVRSMLFNSTIATHVATTTVSTSDPRVERSGLSSGQMGSDFYVGSTNLSSSLPVELLSFTATVKTNSVELKWITASELNNDHFDILHSTSGDDFKHIGVVKGNGTSNAAHTYTLTDVSPATGRNYYQLKQTDFDGKTTLSEVVAVDFKGSSAVSVYPNPVRTSEELTVVVNGLESNVRQLIRVVNMQGTISSEIAATTDSRGSLNANTSVSNLPPGIYILSVAGRNQRLVVK